MLDGEDNMFCSYCIEVEGGFACFTRPEMKVERVSYEVITPSAARAIFEAILWKPAIQWRITKIEVLNPIKWISVRRNEVGKKFGAPSVKQMQGQLGRGLGLFVEDERQQRAGLLLRDVKYRLHADLLFDQAKDVSSNYKKYSEMFERRMAKGQCFNQPYLGCREFSCAFRLVKNLLEEPEAIKETRQLGWMLYDVDYSDRKNLMPRFFEAKIEKGVVIVPDWDGEEVRG